MAKKFPQTIFVVRDGEDTRDEYLRIADDGAEDTSFDTNTPVAVYQLADVGEVKVSRTFQSKRATRRR